MPALPEGDKSYEFIAIDDFSPGIYSEWYASSGIQSAPDGAAQATGTFRCCAGTTGALIPGPRKIASAPFYNNAFSFAGVTISDTNFVQADHFAHVLAMRVLPASYPPGGGALNQPAMLMSGINDHLCLMVQFYTNAGAAPPTKGYGWAVIHNAAGF